ncbi:hypothetical protein CsSME_00015764 [Camellia sinensis var. sinensis]
MFCIVEQVISDGCRKYGRKKRTRIEDLYNNDEAKFSVMERAEEVLANVADGFPSFVKCMLPSNVTHGFWLILPKKFCNLHLPMHDTTVILADECGKEYEANYLVERHGLSAGWRAFSLAHRLLKGDRLVFHLIKPCTLKDPGNDILSSDKNIRTRKKAKKCVKSHLLDIPQKKIKKNGFAVLHSNQGLVADKSKTYSNILPGNKNSDTLIDQEDSTLALKFPAIKPTSTQAAVKIQFCMTILSRASIVGSQPESFHSLLKVDAIGACKPINFSYLEVEDMT